MSIRVALEELDGAHADSLPAYCNVLVRIAERPYRVNDERGGRWHVAVEGLSGGARAFVAVHEDPKKARLGLPYTATEPDLLQLFAERQLRDLIVHGETALLQAVPRIGEAGLWLNVPAIFVLRPFLRFGRNTIDYETKCARKMYLSQAKGVRRPRQPGDFHPGTVSGHVADDLLAAAIRASLPSADEDALVGAVTSDSIRQLVCLALQDKQLSVAALNRSKKALHTLRSSPSVRSLLAADVWGSESGDLNNGVLVAPDLLGARHVVEMKFIGPNSPAFDPARFDRQLRDYLAWAMVEYGAEAVAKSWRGALLHLHPAVNESDRVQFVTPAASLIARRVLNRHRLLGFARAGWLPAPTAGECEYCEFSRVDHAPTSQAAPCMFHCQCERGWDCWSDDPERRCPLLDRCDQFGLQMDFRLIDDFNRLRQVIRDEEEERAAIAELVETLSGGPAAESSGLVLSGFRVTEQSNGEVRLEIPERMRGLDFASRNGAFDLMIGGAVVAVLLFRKRKDNVMSFRVLGRRRIATDQLVSLRFSSEQPEPLREQLEILESAQRRGDSPITLRAAPRKEPLIVNRRQSIEEVDPTARLVLVDATERLAERDCLRRFIAGASGRVLVIAPGAVDLELPELADLTEVAVAEAFTRGSGNAFQRIEAIVHDVAAKKAVLVSREHVFDDSFDAMMSLGFEEVICLGAATASMSLVKRCQELRKRLILIGQAAAPGPRMDSPVARASLLARNTLALLLEAAEHVVLSDLKSLDVLVVRPNRACATAHAVLGFAEPVTCAPLHMHVLSSTDAIRQEVEVRATIFIPVSEDVHQRREIELEVEDERLSRMGLDLVFRGVSARALERLNMQEVEQLDTTVLGYRARLRKLEMQTFSSGSKQEHQLTVILGGSRFPFMQEHLYRSQAEAEAVISFARQFPQRMFHVTSPFVSQCVLIASLACETNVGNVRVYTPATLGRKKPGSERSLLVSLVVGAGSPGYPLVATGRHMLNLLTGEYDEFHLFCSDQAVEHHPVVRRLSQDSSSVVRY